jgi:hypothetical protein
MECGRVYEISEYAEELSPEMWEQISLRPSNRA